MKRDFKFWWNCSRAFALPVTVMSWLVVFIFAIDGNIFNGILALFGVCFAHLATNIFDDYNDYKILSKDEKYLKSAQICKCKLITDGVISHKGMLAAGIVCCLIAAVIGALLAYLAGSGVILVAGIAAVFVLFYSKFTLIGLGEFAVGMTYGPLLFEGVYYVMTGHFSKEVLILSFAVVMFVIAFLYTHTVLDYDGDLCSHKKTLACSFKNKNDALKALIAFYIAGYLFIALFAFTSHNFVVLASYITIPLVYLLYKSMKVYNSDKKFVPEVFWWNYPLGNWEHITEEGTQSFYLRLYLARNINTYFTLIICLALVLEKIF